MVSLVTEHANMNETLLKIYWYRYTRMLYSSRRLRCRSSDGRWGSHQKWPGPEFSSFILTDIFVLGRRDGTGSSHLIPLDMEANKTFLAKMYKHASQNPQQLCA